MTRVQFVAVFVISVQAAILNAATDWSTVVVGLEKSVPRIEILPPESNRAGVCSGVILNVQSGYVLTAAHCLVEDAALTVDGRHAEVARQNRLLDLAVLRTDLPRDAKAIPLASAAPKVGSDVAVIGYAFGAKRAAVQFGRVSLPLNDEGALVLDLMIIGGDSGGPAINLQGQLVGMTSGVKLSHSTMHVGVLVPVEQIREFVSQYLPKVQP